MRQRKPDKYQIVPALCVKVSKELEFNTYLQMGRTPSKSQLLWGQ